MYLRADPALTTRRDLFLADTYAQCYSTGRPYFEIGSIFLSCALLTPHAGFFNGQVAVLHERWHISRHPAYRIALQRLGIAPEVRTNIAVAGGNDAQETIAAEMYGRMGVPPKHAQRFRMLMQDMQRVIGPATKSKRIYKQLRMTLADFANNLNSSDQGLENISAVVRPPQDRSANTSDPHDVQNRSSLVGGNRRPRMCSTCLANSTLSTDSHYAGSSKCPFSRRS